jgi:predicted RNA-binding protein
MARIARTNKIIVRLTDKEKERLENYAVALGVSMSEVIQDYIKSLPDTKIGNSSTILRPVKPMV